MTTRDLPATERPTSGEGWVEASMFYLRDRSARPHKINIEEDRYGGNYGSFPIRVHDARGIAGRLGLDRTGFVFANQQSAVKNFFDEEEIKRVYYPELEAFVQRATGAAKVVAFNHGLRVEEGQNGEAIRGPTRRVHTDYTELTGPQVARQVLTFRGREAAPPEEVEYRLARRYAEYNVWRSIRGPVLRTPLAMVDASTVRLDDLLGCDHSYGKMISETFHAVYNPDHRWYYVPKLGADEVLLFKCYDSKRDCPARYTLHTAFDDPTTPPDAPGRESIEVRLYAFFDE